MPLRQPQQYSPHTSSPSQLLIRASIVGGEPEDTLQQATLSATLPEFFNSLSPAFPSCWAKLNFFIPRYSFIHSFTNEGIFFFSVLVVQGGSGLAKTAKGPESGVLCGTKVWRQNGVWDTGPLGEKDTRFGNCETLS